MPILLFVVNDAPFFLAYFLKRAKAAAQVGFEVHVAVPPSNETRKIEQEGFSIHFIPMDRKGLNPLHELKSFWALYRLYRHLRPLLVHHITIKPNIYGGIAAQVACLPAVVNAVTGLGYTFVPRGAMSALLRRALVLGYRLASRKQNVRITVENPDDYQLFVQERVAPGHRIRVIKGGGVDTEEFKVMPETEETPVVLFAARMLWDKGVADFITAARQLKQESVEVRFVLVGDTDFGNPSAVPREQLKNWHDSGVIEWWGRRTDMPAVFAGSHIVCLPSYYREGIPRVLIEAASAGRPITTTDTPGCREVVRHGENGLLVPPRDPVALSDAIRALVSNSSLRKQMGARGREIAVAEFSKERVIKETLAVYRELLGPKWPGPTDINPSCE